MGENKTKDCTSNNEDIILAFKKGNIRKVQSLLKKGNTKINVKDNEGNTPFILAAKNGHTEIFQLLLSLQLNIDIDVKAKDNDGYTPLHWATENGHTEIFQLLLSQPGIEINAKNN